MTTLTRLKIFRVIIGIIFCVSTMICIVWPSVVKIGDKTYHINHGEEEYWPLGLLADHLVAYTVCGAQEGGH